VSKCLKCETEDQIVHSGVDALLLGIDGAKTGEICYPCANDARAESLLTEAPQEDQTEPQKLTDEIERPEA